MSTLSLRLYEDHLPAGCPPVHLPAAPRGLYVREGGLSIEDATGGRHLAAGAGDAGSDALTLLASDDDVVLWRWELGPAGDDDAGLLRSSPSARSRLVLAHDVSLDPGHDWLLRCDRVDFPPGGVALTHVHQGPGIRICEFGEITIETEGRSAVHGPGDAWFEVGPSPVLAPTTEREPTGFVRCLLLPRVGKGRSSIRYVRPEDADAPKVQRYRVFAERFIDLPG